MNENSGARQLRWAILFIIVTVFKRGVNKHIGRHRGMNPFASNLSTTGTSQFAWGQQNPIRRRFFFPITVRVGLAFAVAKRAVGVGWKPPCHSVVLNHPQSANTHRQWSQKFSTSVVSVVLCPRVHNERFRLFSKMHAPNTRLCIHVVRT